MARAGQHYEYATHNLWDLCYRGDARAAAEALKRGIDVNVRNKIGWTPLHAAAAGGSARPLELLLDRGADVDATDNGGRTAAHEAAKSGGLYVLKLLGRAGASLSATDNKGARPLDVASGEAVRKFLVAACPAIRDSSRDGKSRQPAGGHTGRDDQEAEDGARAARCKGRSFVRGDDGCSRSVRKVRYSTKQKKELLKEKRRKQREAAEEPEENVADALEQQKHQGQEWKPSVKGGRAGGRGLGLTPWQGTDDQSSWTEPLAARLPPGGRLYAAEGFAEPWGIPMRPSWQDKASCTKEEMHNLEEESVYSWVRGVLSSADANTINSFESSVRRWRCLWVAAEKADVVILVLDARHPPLHLSQGIVDYLHGELGKPLALALSKADLVPQGALLAWKAYLEDKHPELPVLAVSCLSRDPEEAQRMLDALGNLHTHSSAAALASDNGQSSTGGSTDGAGTKPVNVAIVGDPNTGKSALVNFLLQRKAVASASTPHTTKRLQTHLAGEGRFLLCDCPPTTVPRLGIPPALEVLGGTYPIAQCPDPYAVLRFYAERCPAPLQEVHQLEPSGRGAAAAKDRGTAGDALEAWSPYGLATATAIKMKWYLRRRGEPDAFRGAHHLLKGAITGTTRPLVFWPPPTDSASQCATPEGYLQAWAFGLTSGSSAGIADGEDAHAEDASSSTSDCSDSSP